ncbi:hypothetical protein BJ508DRAFT_308261 [Ascobolus immersus RN42]|uniref:C2H2-domain containing protein second zinc finger domain-containing protein n=1 Tax=Ascobolus immersus RN42 TaxID=1160509 RepID=A0A3N4I5Q2_ASCIM|nr:hypothetical protein BJ508DRAFT_308261 [Ascobolus immersus RN42]
MVVVSMPKTEPEEHGPYNGQGTRTACTPPPDDDTDRVWHDEHLYDSPATGHNSFLDHPCGPFPFTPTHACWQSSFPEYACNDYLHDPGSHGGLLACPLPMSSAVNTSHRHISDLHQGYNEGMDCYHDIWQIYEPPSTAGSEAGWFKKCDTATGKQFSSFIRVKCNDAIFDTVKGISAPCTTGTCLLEQRQTLNRQLELPTRRCCPVPTCKFSTSSQKLMFDHVSEHLRKPQVRNNCGLSRAGKESLCTVKTCARSISGNGFRRRDNLKQHLLLVHRKILPKHCPRNSKFEVLSDPPDQQKQYVSIPRLGAVTHK